MEEIFVRTKCSRQLHWVEPLEVRAGLAITPWVNSDCSLCVDRFVITHIPSGRKVTEHYTLTEPQARAVLSRLADLCLDWEAVTGDDRELQESVRAVLRRVSEEN
jgi:hypothetical protein